MSTPVPARGHRVDGYVLKIEGEEVSKGDFSFQSNDPVFVDGSGFNTQWHEVSAAGMAAVQISQGTCRILQYPLAWDLPQQANTAEHLILLAVAQNLNGNKAPVVSDCLGVVKGFAKTSQERTQYKLPNAGFGGAERLFGHH